MFNLTQPYYSTTCLLWQILRSCVYKQAVVLFNSQETTRIVGKRMILSRNIKKLFHALYYLFNMFYSHCHLLHQLAYKAFNPWFSQFYLCNHGLWLNRHHRKKSQIASVSKVSRVDSRDFWFLCWSLDFFRHPFWFFRSLKLEYFSLQIVQAEEWEWFLRHESGRKNSKIAYLYKYIPA